MVDEVKIRVFVSYSHLDEEWMNELQGHLSFLRKYGEHVWHDRKIGPGSQWDGLIHEALHHSNIILLLISSHFLASNYCYNIEFKQALKRHENLEAVVVPIIIHDVYWQWREHENVKGLVDLNALPTDGKAVSNPKYWASKHEAFTNVAKGIETVVTQLTTRTAVGETNLTQAQKVAAKFFSTTAISYGKGSSGVLDTNHFNNVYSALSSLNFIEQRIRFRQFLYSDNHVGSFLLHGKRGFGQDWILNELLRQLPGDLLVTALPFKFSFGRSFAGALEDLWYDLGVWAGVDSNVPGKIVETVYTLWQTKTLIFVLRDIDPREQDYLLEFLQVFWYPLAEKVLLWRPEAFNYCLLFLVSYSDRKWELATWPQRYEPPLESCCPIELERLAKFRQSELKHWMGREYRLPPSITVEKILENSQDGLPDLVLRNICRLSGDNWKRREKAWIPY